ncbi:MAG: DUF1513 domain-containing protein [Pseudomonadota bacterium]
MAAALLGEDGRILAIEPIDARGHGGAFCPARSMAVLFARRPGLFAVILDLEQRRRVGAFSPPPKRRFAGHGAFSADGKLLYAAENDFDGERGVIGIYDASDSFRRLGEFDTFGIGPHEMLMMADGTTIAVANGGIATHPDFPRMKLNLAKMAPSLVLLRASDGALLAQTRLPAHMHQLSIRHMAEVRPGVLWFGAQYEGPAEDLAPLVGTFDERYGIRLAPMSDSAIIALKRYVGSVAASGDGGTVITTSPRGGVALEWDGLSGQMRAMHRLRDVCGAARKGPNGLLLTTGTGAVVALEGEALQTSVSWDNHLTALR